MAHVEVRGESWSKYVRVRVTGTGSVVYKIEGKKMYSTRSEYMTCTVDIIYYFVAAFIHTVCVYETWVPQSTDMYVMYTCTQI